MRYFSTNSITWLNSCWEACGRRYILHHLQQAKETISVSPSAKDIVHITEEPNYHSGIAGLALFEVKLWEKKKSIFFTALHERILVTTRHPSNIKLTPKSQHDILTVMHCCSLCQGSAHLNSWLMQELDTHPFAGIQPPYGPCLHSNLSGEFLPLHPNILQVFFLFGESMTLHLFPPPPRARCSLREFSSHMKHS